jgi:UPF0755 protein
MKKYISIAVILFVVLMIAFFYYAKSPVNDLTVTQKIDIPRGSSFTQITEILCEAGLVKNRPLFWLLALGKGVAGHIRAGQYELAVSMSPSAILDKLVRGNLKSYIVTLPEGLTYHEIVKRLASINLITETEFLTLSIDKVFLDSLGIKGNSIEGYLYPDTYYLNQSMSTKEVMRVMVSQFWKEVSPEMLKRAQELHLSTTEFVTLASIIGKETVYKEEKTLVSVVFHNRLKKEIPLQSDPTAIYGLEREGKLVKKVGKYYRKSDTPYNTYRVVGLPPGPIANPDIDSLRAALYPAPVDYLYIVVAHKDGTHKFSTNIDTHGAYKRK